MNEELSEKRYWDERFEVEDSFEWFGNCCRIYPILELYLKDRWWSSVLHLGCGSSSLGEELLKREYSKFVMNVDYSFLILRKRRQINAARLPIDWLTVDIRMLTLRENLFETIIEKGTLDVFFIGHEHRLWKPSEQLKAEIDSILTQISKLLHNDGDRFISISFQQPHFRRVFLAKSKYRWSIDVHSVSDGNESIEYFVYVMTKGQPLSDEDQLLERGISSRWYWINCSSNETSVSQSLDQVEEENDRFLLNIDLDEWQNVRSTRDEKFVWSLFLCFMSNRIFLIVKIKTKNVARDFVWNSFSLIKSEVRWETNFLSSNLLKDVAAARSATRTIFFLLIGQIRTHRFFSFLFDNLAGWIISSSSCARL